MSELGLISVGVLADMLRQRIEALAADLLPNGKRHGREWCVGGLSGEPGKSLSICLSGGKQGWWKDFASGEGGDALDLVAACLFGGSRRDAVQWAKGWLGLDEHAPRPVARRPAPRPADPEAERAEREKAQDDARRKFAGCQHRISGTPVDAYLRGRAIDLSALGRQPGRLGYHPALWCAETGDRRPAMVAAICAGARIVGVHRTWLQQIPDALTGEFLWQKARLECPKKTLGPWQGGCIPLWRGTAADGAPGPGWRELWESDDIPDGALQLTLTEGIEDALTIAVADPTRRVAAAVSLTGLASVVLPRAIGEVVIAADNDPDAREQAALQKAVDAHARCGRRVLVARAPAPHKDFNDWLRAIAAAKGEAA